MPEGLHPSPWDAAVFGIPCYEITDPSEMLLAHAASTPGHYTVKIDPLADKGLLHQYGFYYTDTLLEPVCTTGQLISHVHPEACISTDVALADVQRICRHAFVHGRFQRDFNLPRDQADQRYVQWLAQMHAGGGVIGLLFERELAGFIAHRMGDDQHDALLLHAVAEPFRGRGLAKFLWSETCRYLFAQGAVELSSSVSAANLPVLNLYASLGFRFKDAVDVYHRLTA
ncbi:MAG: GNAT family N-acetyltransferase [Zetaproteobacteria bacterium CG12_big_fil_rev_8_21_14_0_65_55_1124]|nr:MAG: GNAT family N-acetyltransferase [Zetaproteobacteria bacterium CG1_02_55_237]PIS19967.1 MAG: GNAT family N-acetyltransferase [Zetaproteobacteria bacterium CG08_land_8_20_14_0_20_55_17]PIW43611.1 MAG: GNAT family N-acetyltransferase [Zetaproteobacteria bacterium CG12_big_fil_rev_8_21_14_0_65_55_1124]PIY52721.1 MAG: GNAT family N-acetyltransferase [Zetaproteobacteria bacterium CG_4_10_14_0_8_um_filter_55_43]PIZ37905.1 MAG: GNAT family N-acetyltransferase [Zetaproteobacteria bacterium CG_4_